MSKKIVRGAGRPPAPIEKYLTEIFEPLSLGFSLPRACKVAQVPYTTVKDYYDNDENIRKKIDSLREDTNLHARAKLVGRVKSHTYDHKAVMDWLSNMDEDFSNKGPVVAQQFNINNIEITRGDDED